MKTMQGKTPIFWGLMTGIILSTTAAIAQIAEVPEANADGDFMTAKVLGNRGYYNNRMWLVVDRENLNCRQTPGGEIKTQLTPGSTMTAIFSRGGQEDAIVMKNNKPWLRVRVNPEFNRGVEICYVRANTKYIFPVNNDYIDNFN